MTTTVVDRLGQGRSIDADSFADLTDIPVSEVAFVPDGRLRVTFAGDLSPDVAIRCRIRIRSTDPTQEAAFVAALGAWRANGAYLAIASPTSGQAVAQVRALTQQMQDVLRYLVGI